MKLGTLLVHGTASDLPFRDEVFDGVFNVGGINLFSDPERAVSEFCRVTKKGGTVVIGDEGFSSEFSGGMKKAILKRVNPGFEKSKIPTLPPQLERESLQWFFGGCLYLLIAKKK